MYQESGLKSADNKVLFHGSYTLIEHLNFHLLYFVYNFRELSNRFTIGGPFFSFSGYSANSIVTFSTWYSTHMMQCDVLICKSKLNFAKIRLETDMTQLFFIKDIHQVHCLFLVLSFFFPFSNHFKIYSENVAMFWWGESWQLSYIW